MEENGPHRRRSSRKDPYKCCDAGDIEDAFQPNWVQDAVPEILFIKRSPRSGDRWTGHVALPGGKRDKEDNGDEAAAIRECIEEVGLNLTSGEALLCGALPQRVIITNWGQKPLMVLCPFVFLWTEEMMPPLKLQASEVAAAFWIPIGSLIDGKHRTHHPIDVSDRMAAGTSQLLKPFFKVMFGSMFASAIHLKPEEVSFSHSNDSQEQMHEDLMLWGITYAVLADLLDFLPPFDFVDNFRYPFFKGWDFRIVVWVLAWSYRRRQREDLDEYKFSDVIGMRSKAKASVRPSIIDHMMKEYYRFVRQSVYIVAILRIAMLFIVLVYTSRCI
ncbi:hypothetical protein H072_6092 [Dactylellina haptotyla CBS 200.50]|uniref:Nudix hydrolase domain-containing protein n=1 Tax=Dactylellina haptotyla (strain CBS 200.50) TaxID=1284197 RepID=S8AAX6_DACHA|nr:hypothetical protein H072_6092 [Dactylellina haptotyla CBS 200.50]